MADNPTYQEKCAETCEGCRQDWPIVGHTHWGPSDEVDPRDCTAQTREDYEAELRADITKLRSVCGEAYQFAGAVNAPENVLNNLSNASHGMPLRHATFLPVSDTLDGRKEGTE